LNRTQFEQQHQQQHLMAAHFIDLINI